MWVGVSVARGLRHCLEPGCRRDVMKRGGESKSKGKEEGGRGNPCQCFRQFLENHFLRNRRTPLEEGEILFPGCPGRFGESREKKRGTMAPHSAAAFPLSPLRSVVTTAAAAAAAAGGRPSVGSTYTPLYIHATCVNERGGPGWVWSSRKGQTCA